MKFTSKTWYYIVLVIFLLATISLTIVGSKYNLSWFVSNVQQIRLLPGDYAAELYKYGPTEFITFFIIDILFFSSTLCMLIYSTAVALIKTRIRDTPVYKIKSFIPELTFKWIDSGDYKKYRWISIVLSIVMIGAYIFDLVENLQFLFADNHKPMEWIVGAKIACYVTGVFILLFAWVYYIFSERFLSQWQNLAWALRYNWISLIIILVTFLLLNQFAQGGALIFDLFDHPLQLLICLLLIILLTFFIWQFPDELLSSKIKGLEVASNDTTGTSAENSGKIERLENLKNFNRPLRRLLAIVFNIGLIYACCNVLHKNSLSYGSWVSAITIAMVAAVIYFFLYKRVNKAYSYIKGPQQPFVEINFDKKSNFFWAVFCLEISLIAGVIIGIILFAGSSNLTHCFKLCLLIAFVFFLGCLFIALSPKRSNEGLPIFNMFRLIQLIRKKPDQDSPETNIVANTPGKTRFFFKEQFWTLSLFLAGINVLYLMTVYFTGSLKISSPLNILFSILCFYYSLVLISIIYRKARLSIIPVAVLLGFLTYYTSNVKDNNYHSLTPVEKGEQASFEDYLKYHGISTAGLDQKDSLGNQDTSPLIIIAADGGGLRAAYWNLLIMNELAKQNKDFYRHVFAVTGVSGGAIGQGMYLYMNANNFPEDTVDTITEAIGNANFLSNDLFGTFLTSVAMSFIPSTDLARLNDRAEIMERNYQAIVDNSLEGKKGFFHDAFGSYWNTGSSMPPLFFPLSTQVEIGQRAFPAPVKDLGEAGIATGALDITALKDTATSLSYADAVFTTNRFPLFSPAAKIGSLGHFVDGGYFDNSSVFTAAEIIRFLQKAAPQRPIHVIRIRNSKDVYIHRQFANLQDSTYEMKNAFETAIILSGVINSGLRGVHDWGDDYLMDNKSLFTTHYFDLPFLLDKQEVQNTLRKHLLIDQDTLDLRMKQMKDKYHAAMQKCENFDEPCTCLQQPTLGRILSKNVQQQMECLMGHKDVEKVIEEIEKVF